MYPEPVIVVQLGIVALTLASFAYIGLGLVRIWAFRARDARPAARRPPITVLKPLCGADPELYENLRSFCTQDYPVYQVIFSVRDAGDPALPIVRRLLHDLPHHDLTLVVDESIIGSNYKVSNLANAYRKAKHGIVVIADSDMRVDRNYLARIAAAFEDPAVGAVTCLYRGVPLGGLPSILGAMAINEWFLPSVLVAHTFQKIRFCFGATMAVRRDVLERIGGFKTLASYLADDYMLGKLVSEHGFQVALSSYVVDNMILEPGLKELVRHELRWARTILLAQPVGYAFSFVMYLVPVSVLAAIAVYEWYGSPLLAWGLVSLALLLRMTHHYLVRSALRIRDPAAPWLVPLRDMLSFAVWGGAFFSRNVHWRGRKFLVKSDGQLTGKVCDL